jgi:hypothetical protein
MEVPMAIPTYLPYFVLSGTAISVAAILYGLHRALAKAGWPGPERTRAVRIAALILLGWFVAALALGSSAYAPGPDGVPTIQYGIVLPILIGGLLIWRSSTVARIIDAVPQPWLVGVQLYRALGVIFLILYASGRLPGLFAWPAGVGDIAIGLAAPIVGAAYARSPRDAWWLVWAWNVLGILDLIVAVTTGFLTSPSRFQPFVVEPQNELMTILPMVLIPTYLVPLSILLHLASLAKLRQTRAQAGDVPGAKLRPTN